MIQRREDLRFALKPRQAIRIGGEQLRQDLQRNVSVQFCVVRAIDVPHSARAYRCSNLVRTHPRPDQGRRVRERPHSAVLEKGFGPSVSGEQSRDFLVQGRVTPAAGGQSSRLGVCRLFTHLLEQGAHALMPIGALAHLESGGSSR
jgi:hypothetical protein